MFINDDFSEIENFITERFLDIDLTGISYYDAGIEDELDWVGQEVHATWAISGCTKAVFYFSEFPNYVIKTPYFGAYDFQEEDISYFSGCLDNVSSNSYDYCERESDIYVAACNFELENFFAGTKWLCRVQGRDFYISEKKGILNRVDKGRLTDKKTDNLDDIKKKYGAICRESFLSIKAVANLFENYTEEKVLDFLSFIKDYSINDLHLGNLGYNKDGSICLIDYSSYSEAF